MREAFALSIDRAVLVNSVFDNWYETACSFIAPGSTSSSPASETCSPHDPARAKQLLAEAGVPVPHRVTLPTSNNADSLRLAQAIQASVVEVGFDVVIQPVECSTLLDVQKRGNSSSFLSTGAASNYSGYSDPEVDELLKQAARAEDVATRAELHGKVVTVVARDNPLLYVYRVRSITGCTDDVAGVQTFDDGVVRLSRAAFL